MSDLFTPEPEKRELFFVVPGEVRGKGRPRFRNVNFTDKGTGEAKSFVNTYTDSATKKYESRIALEAARAKSAARWAMVDLATPLRLDVVAVIGIPVSRSKREKARLDGKPAICLPDADNIIKSVADALQNIIFIGDKVLTTITCMKVWDADPTKECLKVKVSTCV